MVDGPLDTRRSRQVTDASGVGRDSGRKCGRTCVSPWGPSAPARTVLGRRSRSPTPLQAGSTWPRVSCPHLGRTGRGPPTPHRLLHRSAVCVCVLPRGQLAKCSISDGDWEGERGGCPPPPPPPPDSGAGAGREGAPSPLCQVCLSREGHLLLLLLSSVCGGEGRRASLSALLGSCLALSTGRVSWGPSSPPHLPAALSRHLYSLRVLHLVGEGAGPVSPRQVSHTSGLPPGESCVPPLPGCGASPVVWRGGDARSSPAPER